MTPGMQVVLQVLRGRRFSLEDEKRTQNELWSVLCGDPKTWATMREVRIAGGIIDFIVDTSYREKPNVGLEVKLKGQPAAIVRQLKRYADEPLLDGLLLVTAKPVVIGPTIGGKPVAVLNLGEAWL